MSHIKMICVVWDDSCASSGWHTRDEFTARTAVVLSIGIFVSETKRHLTITNGLTQYGDVNDPLTIPKCAILYRKLMKFKLPRLEKYL